MGKLEQEVKRTRRRENFQKGILLAVGTAGLLSVAVLAPNALKYLRVKPTRFFERSMNESRNRLIEKGLLVFVEKDGKKFLKITEKGERCLRKWGVMGYKLPTPKRWDKKWRLVTFDIWERRRDVRDNVRRVLQKMGFYQMQRSVWVYPYDCEDFIQLLKADFKVGKGMLYVIADHIENDRALKDHFKIAR